jgi:hypothetical protein
MQSYGHYDRYEVGQWNAQKGLASNIDHCVNIVGSLVEVICKMMPDGEGENIPERGKRYMQVGGEEEY